jgi:hypothetical protein
VSTCAEKPSKLRNGDGAFSVGTARQAANAPLGPEKEPSQCSVAVFVVGKCERRTGAKNPPASRSLGLFDDTVEAHYLPTRRLCNGLVPSESVIRGETDLRNRISHAASALNRARWPLLFSKISKCDTIWPALLRASGLFCHPEVTSSVRDRPF